MRLKIVKRNLQMRVITLYRRHFDGKMTVFTGFLDSLKQKIYRAHLQWVSKQTKEVILREKFFDSLSICSVQYIKADIQCISSKIMAFKENFWGLECSVTHRVIRTGFFLGKTIVSKDIFARIQQKTSRCGRDEKVNAFIAGMLNFKCNICKFFKGERRRLSPFGTVLAVCFRIQ